MVDCGVDLGGCGAKTDARELIGREGGEKCGGGDAAEGGFWEHRRV